MSCSSALSSIVLEALLAISMTFFEISSTESSFISLYSQLISLSFYTAALTWSTMTRLRHTTLEVVGFPLTMMYNSGSGKEVFLLLGFLT